MGQDLFGPMSISAAGMSAQQKRMVAISKNIANAEVTKAEDGEAYKRRAVEFSVAGPTAEPPLALMPAPLVRTSPEHLAPMPPAPVAAGAGTPTVQAKEVVDPNAGFQLVYDPQHPDAGPDGYVRMPDINMVTEMVDMVAATRAYEANLAAMKAYQHIVSKSLEI
jgi:flagellar basal-body rod protein FlgC